MNLNLTKALSPVLKISFDDSIKAATYLTTPQCKTA